MELDPKRVKEKLSLILGEPAEERESALREALCWECGAQAAARVRPELEDGGESFRESLESLAAAMALYRLALMEEALAPESVSGPEIQVKLGSRGEKARRLMEEAEKACAPALGEVGFYFGRT